ncbi:flavodoxin I [Draconibacterium orientale]|uniref:Flavodoxin n=1 Tax=Draconibacterium orientale TaxID=1168034 RepID=X5DJF8_9BACT|nr:flavodoxin [Draconibacterium orientale]AHW61254.1 flavodoxin FldA [Draconibacterium orientale]SET94474.1 flavodoxin I [Draconibacterium orientale]
MSKIAIFYGPEGGSVNRVADKIKELIGEDKVEMVAVKNASAADLEKYDKIIFGLSTVGKDTWDSSFSSNDWGKFLPEISKVDYSNKTVAVFGLGDHVTYAHAFVDHIGLLGKELMKNDAVLVGPVDTEGYEFEESDAVVDGKFIGLPLDEDFEPEMTDERVTAWVEQIKPDFGF